MIGEIPGEGQPAQALYDSYRTAGEAIGLDPATMDEFYRQIDPHVHILAAETDDGTPISAVRAHAGDDAELGDLVGAGGITNLAYGNADTQFRDSAKSASIMSAKINLAGYNRSHRDEASGEVLPGYRGAKLAVDTVVDPRTLPHEHRAALMRKVAVAMFEAGLSPDRDKPAGDLNTNDLMDDFALALADRTPRWQASVTGQSPENGGSAFRPEATGYGAFVAHRTWRDSRNESQVDITSQGFGAATAPYLAHATDPALTGQDQGFRLRGLSDRDGMLYTPDKAGIIITPQMMHEIGFAADEYTQTHKMRLLLGMIAVNQPGLEVTFDADSDKLLYAPTDYLVLGARSNVLTGQNAHDVQVESGVLEIGNAAVTADGAAILHDKHVPVLPDSATNVGGVVGSIEDHRWAMLRHSHPDLVADLATHDVQTKAVVETVLASGTETVIRIADKLGTDLRVAASALSMARFISDRSISRIDHEVMVEALQPTY